MARRDRRQDRLKAPDSDYTDAEGNTLSLRGSMKLGARREYAEVLAGTRSSAAATIEDSSQRAMELLFERLAVRWVIAGAPIVRQRELLARLRIASTQERAWVRQALREHCVQHFPDVQAP
ncbi:MAG TPA: hypothetical protein VGN25_09960 [Solirubrobacteraceae bacterium]|nr:hypothetical protein [Solirubrobacteraceae bacterium]